MNNDTKRNEIELEVEAMLVSASKTIDVVRIAAVSFANPETASAVTDAIWQLQLAADQLSDAMNASASDSMNAAFQKHWDEERNYMMQTRNRPADKHWKRAVCHVRDAAGSPDDRRVYLEWPWMNKEIFLGVYQSGTIAAVMEAAVSVAMELQDRPAPISYPAEMLDELHPIQVQDYSAKIVLNVNGVDITIGSMCEDNLAAMRAAHIVAQNWYRWHAATAGVTEVKND